MMTVAMAIPRRVPSRSITIVTIGARAAPLSAATAGAPPSPPLPRCGRPPRPRQRWSSRRFRSARCAPLRSFSSSSSNSSSNSAANDGAPDNRLRIAVVGGGAAGMTAALHLSPLVAAGLIRGPVDVYESTVVKKSKNSGTRHSGHTNDGQKGGDQLYPGSGAIGREIGVGIWSTAWWPFLRNLGEGFMEKADPVGREKDRQSYKTLLQDLEACGSYVEDVGYRTPNGSWLVKSELNASPFGIEDLLGGDPADSKGRMENDDPALLFVREKDLLSCLRNAIKIERRLGTIKYNSGVRVAGIENVNGDLGSLVLQNSSDSEETPSLSPQYHLIIAADGMYSPLRSRFAGHHSSHATGTGIESSTRQKPEETLEYKWEHTKGQRQATQVEDREYIVFRGNAPKLESYDEDGSGSFQTWGVSQSMRFAAVPFYHETEDLEDDENDDSNSHGHYSKSQTFTSKKKDEEVWFATISEPTFMEAIKNDSAATSNSIHMKQLLMKRFGSWHKPVQKLIETTPAENIMYEQAKAHRHLAGPVFDVARIMEFEMWQEKMKAEKNGGESYHGDEKINGRGPILAFIGDSFMTVDPVLAQGFTIAMESGASIARSIESVLVNPATTSPSSTHITYNPKLLREELRDRHYRRERRLLQLLRSTELVQRMAQPHGIGSIFATWIVRPMVKLCPEAVKKRVFDYVIRYSLGLTGGDGAGGDKR